MSHSVRDPAPPNEPERIGGEPAGGTEDPDRTWLREVYRGDSSRQLTVRAVIAGMLLGGALSLSNLYVSLKTGWSFGVTITAGILAYVIFGALHRARLLRTEFGILENNAMQSVASAAGYMTGGGTAAAIPALMLDTGKIVPWYVIFLWITSVAMLGVFMAIPMKRQLINQEQLTFPSGIAAAETLKSLHPHDAFAGQRGDAPAHDASTYRASEERPKRDDTTAGARALLWAGLLGVGYQWLRVAHMSNSLTGWKRAIVAKLTGLSKIPEMIELPARFPRSFADLGHWLKGGSAAGYPTLMIAGEPAFKFTFALDTSLLLLAAGAIMGWRPAWSMFFGSLLNYLALAPYGLKIGAIATPGYKPIIGWTVWFGSSLLLTSGLLSFAFSWRQVARAFGDLGRLFGDNTPGQHDPMADVEAPMSWFAIGVLALTPIVVTFGAIFFGISWWLGLVCVALSFFLAIVACRATGETDQPPTGALAKIVQIVSGVLAPGSVPTNLMTASMSGGVAIHSADLLTDLKSGYVLGAKPRQQFLAQLFGVVAGSAFVVPAFRLFVPDASVIGTTRWPAPGAISWLSVSKALAKGIDQLPVSARWLILAGGVLGILMVLAERAWPKYRKFMPSAVGFGLGFTLPAWNALSMFLGALAALGFERRSRALAKRYVVPVSSGVIAGESIIGVVITLMQMLNILEP